MDSQGIGKAVDGFILFTLYVLVPLAVVGFLTCGYGLVRMIWWLFHHVHIG